MSKPTQQQYDRKVQKIQDVESAYQEWQGAVNMIMTLVGGPLWDEITDPMWDRIYNVYLTKETNLKSKVAGL